MNNLKVIFDRDTWQEIFGSISKNKVRTVITVIGVLWGIFIYITLSGAAKGLDNGFERQFENIAMNSMFIWAERTSIPYAGFKTGRNIQLTLSDMDYIKKTILHAAKVFLPKWAKEELIIFRNMFVKNINNFNIYKDSALNNKGIEIGGPSNIFHREIPVYRYLTCTYDIKEIAEAVAVVHIEDGGPLYMSSVQLSLLPLIHCPLSPEGE